MNNIEFGYRESVKDAIALAAHTEGAMFFKGIAFALYLYAQAVNSEQWAKDRDAIHAAISDAGNRKQ